MAAALCTTHKKENFQRLAGLLMCGGVTLLREVFDTIHPPANLPLKLNDPATKTQLKGAKLTKPEWDWVYPSAGICGKSTDFDITLLFRLLRTICHLTPPATGWDKLPINTDHSLEADLARIKYYRNSVYGHNHTMEITGTDFSFLWREISEALLRIAGTISPAKRDEWKESINKLLHDPLTPDAERYVAELQSWYKKDIDTKDEVEKLGNKLEQMNVKHDKQQEQIEMMNIMLQQLTVNHNQQMNILLEHIINIHTTIKSTKPGGSSITQSQFSNTPLVQQPGLHSETVCLPEPITPEQPDPTDLDIWQVILSSCNFPLLFEKLRMKFGVDVQSSRLGSLVMTVSCSSLEILEGLWKDYSSGHLNEVVQETLVTADVLKKLNLNEVKLKTVIFKKEYKACKQLLLQRSGNENLQQPCAEETSTRGTPSITPSIRETPSITTSRRETPSITTSTRETPSITTSTRETPSITTSTRETTSITTSTRETPSITTSTRESPSITPSTRETTSITPSTRETTSITTSTSDDSSDESESIPMEIQETASQGAVMVPRSLDSRPVSDTVFHDIGRDLGTSWKRLGRCLGIPEKDLEAIDVKERDIGRKGMLMLNMWKETWGEYATGVVLKEALEEIKKAGQLEEGETKTIIPYRPAAALVTELAAHERTYVKYSEIPEGADYTTTSGYVMMINNYYFLHRETLRLQTRLQHLFDFKFGFRSTKYDNLTKSEMLNELMHTAEKDFSEYDCFVCVIQSKGSKDGIFGIDDEMINPETITSLFTRDKCPSLDGKPKIFLIETIGRSLTDEGPLPRPVISEDDFLIWYAALNLGRGFPTPLSILTESLEYHSSNKHLMDILMSVNEEAESEWPYRHYRPYTPLYLVSTLTKKCFLKANKASAKI